MKYSVLHVKHTRRGPEVKQHSNYWWVEFHFGQEPVFIRARKRADYAHLEGMWLILAYD